MALFDFMGSGARSDLQAGTAAANAALQSGLKKFTNTSNEFLDRSNEFLTPGIGRGERSNDLLEIALGTRGREAQQGYFGDFVNDPGVQSLINSGNQAVERSAAARGGVLSGNTLSAVANNTAQIQNQVFNDRLSRLAQLGGRGDQLSSIAAGNTLNTGQNIAGAQFGAGQLFANNAINQGNAMAQNRQTGLNNLLGIAQVGASAFGGR